MFRKNTVICTGIRGGEAVSQNIPLVIHPCVGPTGGFRLQSAKIAAQFNGFAPKFAWGDCGAIYVQVPESSRVYRGGAQRQERKVTARVDPAVMTQR